MIHDGEQLDGRVEASGMITRNGRLQCINDIAGKEGKQGVARAILGRLGESPGRGPICPDESAADLDFSCAGTAFGLC